MVRNYENQVVEPQCIAEDIGGTDCVGGDATKGWASMVGVTERTYLVRLGRRTGADVYAGWTDPLTTLRVEQATSATGAGKKVLTTPNDAGADYAAGTALTTAGDLAILTVRAVDMDRKGKFTHVRVFAACTADTAEDAITIESVKDSARQWEFAYGAAGAHRVYFHSHNS